jgi:aminopeptidase N
MQARYNFTLTVPANLTALFNTRERSQQLQGSLCTRNYELTPPMSSYLVAFVIGNLTNASAVVPGPSPFSEPRTVSVWGTPDR